MGGEREPDTETMTTVSVKPSTDATSDIVSLLIVASNDAGRLNTMLPKTSNEEEALNWLSNSDWCMWVIYADGVPAGIFSAHPTSITDPHHEYSGYLETDIWIIPEKRGQRIASEGEELVYPVLATITTHLVAESWEENESVAIMLRRDGWTCLGRTWWDGTAEGYTAGWCLRWTLELPAVKE